jgi:hypothetical protein
MTTDQCFSTAKEGSTRRDTSSHRPSEGEFEGCWQEVSDNKPEVYTINNLLMVLTHQKADITIQWQQEEDWPCLKLVINGAHIVASFILEEKGIWNQLLQSIGVRWP